MPLTSPAAHPESVAAVPRPRRRPVSSCSPAPRPMRLLVERPGGGVVVVSVSGEVDALTAPRLAELLTNRLRGGPTRLVVDLSSVTFLGVAGLSVLAQTALRARILGKELRIVSGHNRMVRRLLDVTAVC